MVTKLITFPAKITTLQKSKIYYFPHVSIYQEGYFHDFCGYTTTGNYKRAKQAKEHIRVFRLK